jgi:tetratricopeptide (TPR) repeat protein
LLEKPVVSNQVFRLFVIRPCLFINKQVYKYEQSLNEHFLDMPFRFFQRIRIAPGLTLNLSKGGVSVSAGPRGARFTAGTSGTRATVGLPGSGLHYTVLNPHKKLTQAPRPAAAPKLGWLQRITLPKADQAFVQGWQAWGQGQTAKAVESFESVPAQSAAGPDAAWSAALFYTQQEQFDKAAALLRQALQTPHQLGKAFEQHGMSPRVQVPVTPNVQATMQPCAQSAQLLLAEVLQSQGQRNAALRTLEALIPSQAAAQVDPVVLAAYGELALEANDASATQRFLTVAATVGNDTPVHTVVMYYRAQALVNQGLHTAALEVLSPGLRRTKDRSPDLLLNIRHLRAQVYQALGRKAQARADLERIYAEDPGFEGVAEALGLS